MKQGRQRKVIEARWVLVPRHSRGRDFGTWNFWTLVLDNCFHTVYRFNQSDKAPTKALCNQCPAGTTTTGRSQ